MTSKEAIDYLKDTGGYTFVEIDNPRHNEAINLAIKALEEGPHDDWIKELIEELESRKSYGVEYAQAMEDVITILAAKFGVDEEVRE